RNVCRYWRRGLSSAKRERRRAGINDTDEIRTRADAGQRIARVVILCIEIGKLDGCGSGELSARGESHDADFVGVEIPFFGVSAHHADGLERVVDFIRFRVVAIAAETITQ